MADLVFPTSRVAGANQFQNILRSHRNHGLFHEGTCGQVTAGVGMAVALAAIPAGAAIVNGTVLGAVSAGSTTISAAHASLPRRDVIWVDTTGTFGNTTGTAAAVPAPPAITDTRLRLAELYVAATATSFVDSDYTDARVNLTSPRFIRKTANESVTSSVVLQNDDHLFFSIFPNEVWTFDLYAHFHSGNSTGGLQADFTVPAGCAGSWFVYGTNATTLWISGNNPSIVTGFFTSTGTTISGANLFIHGEVRNGATPGTVNFRWAQVNSNGTATTMSGDGSNGSSWLTIQRVL